MSLLKSNVRCYSLWISVSNHSLSRLFSTFPLKLNHSPPKVVQPCNHVQIVFSHYFFYNKKFYKLTFFELCTTKLLINRILNYHRIYWIIKIQLSIQFKCCFKQPSFILCEFWPTICFIRKRFKIEITSFNKKFFSIDHSCVFYCKTIIIWNQ